MAAARDPFRVLSLPYDATAEDVRRAFRRRAYETHPDHGGAAAAFHEVRVAYGALIQDLERERRRWRLPAPPPAPKGDRRYAAGLDPRFYPTCPVRIGRSYEGKRTVAYATEKRPAGWRPPRLPPPGGTCVARHAATDTAPAFGIWIVPLDAHRFRCVFGPYPPGG